MTDIVAPALAGHQFFRGMPAHHLAYLAGTTSLATFPARHRIFEAGAVAQHFWLIRAGQVALDLRVPGAGRVIVETIGRGEMVGVSWFFAPFQWQFGAVAVQPTEAFQFDAAAVRQRCDTDPDFGYQFTRRMIAVVARRLQATRIRLLDVCTSQELPGR